MIAASHGPVYQQPDIILDAYREWIADTIKNDVIIAYISMHGSTKKMVDHLAASLIRRGITVREFEMSSMDMGRLAISLVDAATLVMATPAVDVGAHPLAAYVAYFTKMLRPKLKHIGMIGSYSWAHKVTDHLQGFFSGLRAETLSPVMVKGLPGDDDFFALEQLAEAIAEKHKNL